MFKKLLLILCMFFLTSASIIAYAPCIPKGTLVKVNTKIVYSTANLEEGSEVYFIAPADVWVLENKAIAEGDIFKGYVSMLKMPVQGINAAMSININQLQKKSGNIIPIEGRIIFANSDTLGGNLTNPLSYNKTIHPRKTYGNAWGGTLQYVPSGEYEFGQHVGITPRDSLFVEFLEDFYI